MLFSHLVTSFRLYLLRVFFNILEANSLKHQQMKTLLTREYKRCVRKFLAINVLTMKSLRAQQNGSSIREIQCLGVSHSQSIA